MEVRSSGAYPRIENSWAKAEHAKTDTNRKKIEVFDEMMNAMFVLWKTYESSRVYIVLCLNIVRHSLCCFEVKIFEKLFVS